MLGGLLICPSETVSSLSILDLSCWKCTRVMKTMIRVSLQVDKVPCYIKQFFPDAKFVVTLRHPVDRTMSYLNMMRSRCMQKKEADPKKQLACCEDVFSDIAERLALSVENMRGASQQCLNVSSSSGCLSMSHCFSNFLVITAFLCSSLETCS